MKIGKKMKKVGIENPWRPPLRFPRSHTICRITEGSILSVDPDVYSIQIDADFQEKYWAKINSIPNPFKYFCPVLEMHFTTTEYLEELVFYAKKHFDVVHFEDKNSKFHILKERSK